MARYTYSVEVQRGDQWFAVVQDEQRGFAYGYYLGCLDGKPPPRLAHRVIRSDGRVVDEFGPSCSVSIGMAAGSPTPEQYISAARRAELIAMKLRRAAKTSRDGGPA